MKKNMNFIMVINKESNVINNNKENKYANNFYFLYSICLLATALGANSNLFTLAL